MRLRREERVPVPQDAIDAACEAMWPGQPPEKGLARYPEIVTILEAAWPHMQAEGLRQIADLMPGEHFTPMRALLRRYANQAVRG